MGNEKPMIQQRKYTHIWKRQALSLSFIVIVNYRLWFEVAIYLC